MGGALLLLFNFLGGSAVVLNDPGATCRTAASITASGVGATIAASATGQTITCD